MSAEISALDPKEIWENFAQLNTIPRPSKKEEKVIQFMLDYGKKLGLETKKDAIGNVVIKKPATKGMEDRQTIILQSHLDMVCQKNNDTEFDFDTQGIKMLIKDGWVTADGTTLGADNGIGVATIMGILASDSITHPALEAMFTIDEETGMTGAMQLDPSNFSGTILLNLDTEDEDEISVGCAGGIDTDSTYHYEKQTPVSNVDTYKVELKGLMGGHSGMDIDSGRANANKLMARILVNSPKEFYLHELEGGGLRNAIPRECVAVVSVEKDANEAFLAYLKKMEATLQREFAPIEKDLILKISSTETPKDVVATYDKNAMLLALNAVHNGVFKMSLDIPDLVESSSSLAHVTIKDGVFKTQSLQRSSVESTKDAVKDTVGNAFRLMGAEVNHSGSYPGWSPNMDSKILQTLRDKFEAHFNKKPNVMACHAGLECGILGEHLPDVDMISFGPNIRGAHSPDEKVEIASVQKFWSFLLAILADAPKK